MGHKKIRGRGSNLLWVSGGVAIVIGVVVALLELFPIKGKRFTAKFGAAPLIEHSREETGVSRQEEDRDSSKALSSQVETAVGEPASSPLVTLIAPYSAELPVEGEGSAEREQGFRLALEQILINQSNKPQISELPQIKSALANPTIYIQRYTYLKRDSAVDSYSPGTLLLQIECNSRAVTQLVKTALQQLAAAERKSVQLLLWLVKDSGTTKMLEVESSNDLLIPILQQEADRLGITLVLPTLDLTELHTITPADICRLDSGKLLAASGRYGVAPVVAGCIHPPIVGGKWESHWLLVDEHNNPRPFNVTGATAAAVIGEAFQLVLTHTMELREQYTRDYVPESRVRMRITNVNGLAQYNEVVGYLRTFKQIGQIDLVKMSATAVELSINIIGEEKRFLRALAAQKSLVRNLAPASSEAGIELDYRWVSPSDAELETVDSEPLS